MQKKYNTKIETEEEKETKRFNSDILYKLNFLCCFSFNDDFNYITELIILYWSSNIIFNTFKQRFISLTIYVYI